MLFYAMLAAALPLALALACPCPPAPADSEVCGSDHVTYDSQCHLQCAAEPDVSLKHPGPCSATEELERWRGCDKQRQCSGLDADATHCGCGERDYGCKYMCMRNCACRCGGYPQGGMDIGVWIECTDRKRCRKTHDQCNGGCGGEEECEASCSLDNDKCACECVQEASAPQRKRNWTACLEQHQCHSRTCSECTGAGPICDKRCKKRCRCECAGWPRRDLSGEWEKCFKGTQTCEEAHSACVQECPDQDDCKDKCSMARLDCECECRTAEGEEWRLWDECKRKEACEDKTCRCPEGDTDCAERCRRNCGCRCLGINADSLEDDPLQECKLESRCDANRKNCRARCKTAKGKDCELSCNLAFEKCYCECSRSRPPKRVEIIQHCNFIN